MGNYFSVESETLDHINEECICILSLLICTKLSTFVVFIHFYGFFFFLMYNFSLIAVQAVE